MSKKHRKRQSRTDAVSKPQTIITANEVAQAVKNVQRQHALMMAQLQTEDRRKFHPDGRGHRPARLINGSRVPPHKVKNTLTKARVIRGPGGRPMKTKKLSSLALPHRIKFALPAKTLICIKRKIRSEVLHAFNKTGKGGARRNRPRRNSFSQISC